MIARVNLINDQDSLTRYVLHNKEVFILGSTFTAGWPAMRDWVSPVDGKSVNVDYLNKMNGDKQVVVIVGTGISTLESIVFHEMRFGEFVQKYCGHYYGKARTEVAYVKNLPVDESCFDVPSALKLALNHIGDATRFVDGKDTTSYGALFGTTGSWSCFHVDEKRPGCAWSALIAGRKLWYFVKPGGEEHFRRGPGLDSFIVDIRERRELFEKADVLEIVQEQGEIIFVPAGWYHQVHNLEDSLTINYNAIEKID